jgi:hypothetical protein
VVRGFQKLEKLVWSIVCVKGNHLTVKFRKHLLPFGSIKGVQIL